MYLDYKHLLHCIFPLSEDEKRIDQVSPDDFMHLYTLRETKGIISLLSYHTPVVRSAIHLLKFHNHPHARTLLATVFLHYIQTNTPKNPLIIPVPLSKKRLHTRGYNQVSELLHEANKKYPIGEQNIHILKRIRHTTPQTSLDRAKRITNLDGAFCVTSTKHKQLLIKRHILLVDDVSTTGATLIHAKTALASCSPASVTCVALAH